MIHPRLGLKVRALAKFPGVPKGTTGTVDEVTPERITVTWDLTLPEGVPPQRDGFSREHGLHLLGGVR